MDITFISDSLSKLPKEAATKQFPSKNTKRFYRELTTDSLIKKINPAIWNKLQIKLDEFRKNEQET